MKNNLWFKYGLTFLLINILLTLLAILTSSGRGADILAIRFIQIPFSFMVNNFNIYQTLIIGLTGWFIIGSFIGLIIEKIKSKK